MKRRTIVTATSFVLLVLLATYVSTGAHAQSRPAARSISALSYVFTVAHVRADGVPNTTSNNAHTHNAHTHNAHTTVETPGPRGVAGPRGQQGVAGVAGAPGAPGAAGAPGQPGQPGPTGPAGPAGTAGPTGSQGPQGVVGSIGLTGIPGPSISNIARYGSNAPIVSSNAPGSNGTSAVDDDLTTAWASAVNDSTPTITIIEPGPAPISAVQLYWGDATPRTFHLETCADIAASAIRRHTLPHFHLRGIRPHTPASAAEYCIPANGQAAAPWTPIAGTTYINDTSLGNFIPFPKVTTQYIRLVGMNTANSSYVLDEFELLSPYWWD